MSLQRITRIVRIVISLLNCCDKHFSHITNSLRNYAGFWYLYVITLGVGVILEIGFAISSFYKKSIISQSHFNFYVMALIKTEMSSSGTWWQKKENFTRRYYI